MKYLPLTTFILATLCTASAEAPASQRCSISIEALSAEVKAGSPAYLRIRLLNNGFEEIDSNGPSQNGADSIYIYDCRDDAGKPANKASYGLFTDAGDHPAFKPEEGVRTGESYEESVPINGACNLAAPGKYTVQISRSFHNEDGKDEVVKSNIITITVLPPDPPTDEVK